ncbi:hypothetical protein K3495_g4613 [Podosphaera aphanis]|nr:hypothetical protein K3495_g4613 [Podosphaera aphanis]
MRHTKPASQSTIVSQISLFVLPRLSNKVSDLRRARKLLGQILFPVLILNEENFSSIPNPPSYTNNSYLETEKGLHNFSQREGFEITLGGGIKKNKNQDIYKGRLICAKESRRVRGKSRETCSSTRPSPASKITGCKWAISIIESNIAEPVQGKWFIRLGNTPEHNHGAVHTSGLANHRRRACGNEVQVYLKNAITSGIDPKRTRSLAYHQFA